MIRIATFNLENLDEDRTGRDGQIIRPTFAERAAAMRPALERIKADILCLQEAHGQERPGQPRDLWALKALLSTTRYKDYVLTSTRTLGGPDVYDERNLVVATHPSITVTGRHQINGQVVPNPFYQRTIAGDPEAKSIGWERPLLHVSVILANGVQLEIINVHFKSKIAVPADHLMKDDYTWLSAAGWAEGYFMASLKRVGAALEARVVIDQIFEANPDALILIAGDFNANSDEVPVMAIRGRVEDTGNPELSGRVMVPLENNVPLSSRFTLYHHGKGEMIDHILVSRGMVRGFSHTEIHNEILPDESIAFATDRKFPESDHAPVVTAFDETLLTGATVTS
jgi:endonuclease/exonuclease/phosphatase family metal-dependent hydrolase